MERSDLDSLSSKIKSYFMQEGNLLELQDIHIGLDIITFPEDPDVRCINSRCNGILDLPDLGVSF